MHTISGTAAAPILAQQSEGDAQLPPSFTDAQGREFTLQRDAQSGAVSYVHESQQRDEAGNTLDTNITIRLHEDGSFDRTTNQQLQLVSGDSQHESVTSRHSADGVKVSETVTSHKQQGDIVSSETTNSKFVAGAEVHRESQIGQQRTTTDSDGVKSTISVSVNAVWGDGGTPITDTTVPYIKREETEEHIAPGEGINKDTPRTISFVKKGEGPLGNIVWENPAELKVRFDGHKGQFIERTMTVPMGADGTPNISKAETVAEVDNQNLVNKGFMKARIWGGLASNLAWIGGINLIRGGGGGVGKALVAAAGAASLASTSGEAHALITKRNDASGARLAIGIYDTVLTGLLAAFVSGSPTGFKPTTTAALTGVGLANVGIHSSGINRTISGSDLSASVRDSKLGTSTLPQLAPPVTGLGFDSGARTSSSTAISALLN